MARGWTCRVLVFMVLALSVTALSVTPSSSRMGYDISVMVDGSSWDIHRSTMDLSFSLNGTLKGEGKFSRFCKIDGFAGIKSHEIASSSQPGALDYQEQKLLQSKEGPVAITTKLASGENGSENETHIIVSEGDVIVKEKWPVYYANRKVVSYLGPGMRSREEYLNNGDMVSKYLDSWKLSEYSFYRAHINRSYVHALIAPPRAYVSRRENKSSSYILGLKVIGSSTGIDILQQNDGGSDLYVRDPDLYISQDYVGQQNITLKANMGELALVPDDEDDEWLGCCIDNYDRACCGEERFEPSANSVFNATSFRRSHEG